jgi:BlaI family transcriptional regulator, penicillinase repressor
MSAPANILTPLELKVMQMLWKLEKAFVKDLLEHWQESPKPAYNTISTIVRILQEKSFITHKAYGRTHEYAPAISRETYQKQFLRNTLEKVFEGSLTSLMSTLVDDEKIEASELDEIKKMLNE